MALDSEDYQEYLQVVALHSLTNVDEISRRTRINEDLRILGDDALDLLWDLSGRFDVDLSDFDFERYFPQEATASLHCYVGKLKRINPKNKMEKILASIDVLVWCRFARQEYFAPLTVQDLWLVLKSRKGGQVG